jgi:outer membrane biosynthesis protein TonB
MAAGCVTHTSTAYVPSPGEPRVTTDEARDQLDELLRIECPRLMQAGRESRVARLDLDVDREGHVLRSRIGTSTGDDRVDAMFGAVAAKLQLAPPTEMKNDVDTGHVRMGYSCSANAAVATIDLD